MKDNSYQALDQEIKNLLDKWGANLGAPTCYQGCSGCCQAPMASAAEGIRLLDFIDLQSKDIQNEFHATVSKYVTSLKYSLRNPDGSVTGGDDATFKAIELGGCPFLEGHVCGIYEARPNACRAVHVWHENKYCGCAAGGARVPAELIALRNRYFWSLVEEEVEQGRYPFFGQLQVVLFYLHHYRDAYTGGTECSGIIDPLWMQSGLIGFPYPNAAVTLADVTGHIERQKKEESLQFKQSQPFGLPKATNAKSKEGLYAGIIFPVL
ncbi:MAG: YkgJ family cysteine cluster protein [Gammaproteobacteria bacterium]